MNIPFQYITRLFVAAIVAVSPAFIFAQVVDAVDDIAHTVKNTPKTIDVLQNDFGIGALRLDKVVLENHGKASIENGKIVFTPDADFKGAALLNYTVCDARNECSCGLVIIDIAEPILPIYQEMKIFVTGGTTSQFTLPRGYMRLQYPSYGTVAPTRDTGEWLYRASPNFTGIDRCTFQTIDLDGITKNYEVEFEILPTPPQYVMPDLKSTRPGQTISFNVLENDDKANISSIIFGACTGGQITTNTDGFVNFTPTLSEGGKATFNYTVTVSGGKTETATVTIFISNYLPSKDQFRLTCSGVPLVIKYPAPITGYNFVILSENTDAGGKLKYFSSIDQIIAGQRVTGNNLLLYTPPVGAAPGSKDGFYVKYCVDNNNCSDYIRVNIDIEEFLTQDPQCVGNCVWPGDANGDGVTNMMDLYPIAQNIGQYGKSRNDEDSRIEWYPHSSNNWGKTTYGIEMKHTDTNGDGVVTSADVQAILDNYGKNSTLTPIKTAEESNIEIQLVSSSTSLLPGDMLEMIVSMGSSEFPAYNTKGLSFSLEYNANLVKEQTMTADFSAFNWLSRYDSYLSLSKIAERGKFDAGLVRSKGKGANGHGEVGKVRAIVEDDVSGIRGDSKTTLKFHFNNAYMMAENGQAVKLQTKDLEIPIQLGKKADVLKTEDLVMYPNPASDMVNFHINGVNKIDYVRIMDGAGREVVRVNHVDAKSATVPVADLRGFYIAEIMTEKGRVVKKLEIFK